MRIKITDARTSFKAVELVMEKFMFGAVEGKVDRENREEQTQGPKRQRTVLQRSLIVLCLVFSPQCSVILDNDDGT